jgi:hypothetical protein
LVPEKPFFPAKIYFSVGAAVTAAGSWKALGRGFSAEPKAIPPRGALLWFSISAVVWVVRGVRLPARRNTEYVSEGFVRGFPKKSSGASQVLRGFSCPCIAIAHHGGHWAWGEYASGKKSYVHNDESNCRNRWWTDHGAHVKTIIPMSGIRPSEVNAG